MKTLTQTQLAILKFLQNCIVVDGHPPTLTEIAAAFKFRQPRSAQDHLRALEVKGFLELSPGKARGIRLIEQATASSRSKLLSLPLVGHVAAGKPILAESNVDRHVAIDRSLFRPQPDFLLRVRGESMRDAGILHDDLIAVHRTPKANSGQIVVARIEDEVTVKRLLLSRNKIQLLPDNPGFDPITVDPRSTFVIEGLYVGVIRIA